MDNRKETTLLQDILYLFIKIFAVVTVTILLFTFVFGVTRCENLAMNPAIQDGDLVFFFRLDKNYGAYDTIVLDFDGKRQVRRVVAVAGDTVDIENEQLIINGEPQAETRIYTKTQRYDQGVDFPLTVGEGQVFVLGDNRENVTDSRIYGCVDIKETKGKTMTLLRRRAI